MISIEEVLYDQDLAQPFVIKRQSGTWLNGVWQPTTTEIDVVGVITVATARELEMIPEGDVVHGAMMFHCQQPIHGTNVQTGVPGATSDIIKWRGHDYRVLPVKQEVDWGYFSAIGTRMDAV